MVIVCDIKASPNLKHYKIVKDHRLMFCKISSMIVKLMLSLVFAVSVIAR